MYMNKFWKGKGIDMFFMGKNQHQACLEDVGKRSFCHYTDHVRCFQEIMLKTWLYTLLYMTFVSKIPSEKSYHFTVKFICFKVFCPEGILNQICFWVQMHTTFKTMIWNTARMHIHYV